MILRSLPTQPSSGSMTFKVSSTQPSHGSMTFKVHSNPTMPWFYDP